MTSRLSMSLVAAIALFSGRAYAASGGSGLDHDDTSYQEIASTWSGDVTLEAVPHPTYDDTSYPAAHTTIHKELLAAPAVGSAIVATADDTVYPTADVERTAAARTSEREQERVACGCARG